MSELKSWRAKTARRENVELFRVVSNQALEEIAARRPQDKKELLEIKGIKEKKYAKYGEEILAMVRGEGEEFVESFREDNKIFEVSEYLDILNDTLTNLKARIKGEVSELKNRGSYYTFKLKDKKDASVIDCFIWAGIYEINAVELEDGTEILVQGAPNVWKPRGTLSFRIETVELVGEGALKKAFEELKKKLGQEGLFLPERKKPIAKYVKNIGLISSNQGVVIKDFLTNLGEHGFKIKFIDSRVEGKQAIFDLINAVKWFNEKMPDLDVLVIIRGGGSLESLQAFNAESLVRVVAGSGIPVLCGIGHDTDETLVDLIADRSVSTPSMVANVLRTPWDEAIHEVERGEKNILNKFENSLTGVKNDIRESEHILSGRLANIFERFHRAKENIKKYLVKIRMMIDFEKNNLTNTAGKLIANYTRMFQDMISLIKSLGEKINLHNPERQLKLGYSLVSIDGKIVRSVKGVEVGNEVDIKVSDGELRSKILNKKVEP